MRRSNEAMWRVLRHIVRKYPEERRKGKGEAGRRGGEREGARLGWKKGMETRDVYKGRFECRGLGTSARLC